MADILISYTSVDSEWAKWIAHELEALGHVPHVHEWEVSGGGNIVAWLEERHHKADHILCVISKAYLAAPYSSWELQVAQWAAANKRPNFALPVFVEDCEAPTLFAVTKRCDLYGLSVEDARVRLANFLSPAAKPSTPVAFPGLRALDAPISRPAVEFPGNAFALSNIPITVPRQFIGRDDILADIKAQLANDQGRVAITALHGLRGVGKTTLAAAYAERHRADYRATWWIRAQTEPAMRADLVALGVRLGWVAADEKEEPALAVVKERLRHEGEGLLLIFDNANNPDELRPYLPLGGSAQVLVTSSAPNWGGVAVPVKIGVWSKDVGADFLVARVPGRMSERAAAEKLATALGGLPLAHEQAAAFCERFGISFAAYLDRFEATPAILLDAAQDASAEDSDHMTVAKTFALAIDEASKLHPAAEPLIVHTALLALEPIPLFLFSEAREFGEPLASKLAGDGLDKAVAALRAFALVDRESVVDERDPTITTDCIRLHRLVRQVAAARCEGEAQEEARRALINALAAIYPDDVFNEPKAWPRARRLDASALALVSNAVVPPTGTEQPTSSLLERLALYRQGALAAYSEARPLFERSLAIREHALGPEHPDTAAAVNNLALLLQDQGDLKTARPLLERAAAIYEKVRGPEHPDTGVILNNLGTLLQDQGDLAAARPVCERALAICERALGPEHPDTATSINNLALLLQDEGDLVGARNLCERALAIREAALGPEHPDTAASLGNLAVSLRDLGETEKAEPLFRRAIAICDKELGAEHPTTRQYRSHLASQLLESDRAQEALELGQAALSSDEHVDGPWKEDAARVTADALHALGRSDEARTLREKYGI